MGITTFTGPVRSDNGFQEWDGNAWVPVAGGGGGGSANIYIPNTRGMGNVNVIIPTLENGQSITYVLGASSSPLAGDQITFSYTLNPGDDFSYIALTLYNNGSDPLDRIYQNAVVSQPLVLPLILSAESLAIVNFTVKFTNYGPATSQGLDFHYIFGEGVALTSN